MKVFGEQLLARFARKHADSRKSLARFLVLAENAIWSHAEALKGTFPSADLGKGTGLVIFDIGGNKYRLTALVNFESQSVKITGVFTHEEYSRKNL